MRRFGKIVKTYFCNNPAHKCLENCKDLKEEKFDRRIIEKI